MADHPLGLLKFYNRCSLVLSSCLEAERDHYKNTCVKTEINKRIIYYNCSGKGRLPETEQDRQIHDRLCINNKTFCIICALDTSRLGIEANIRHTSICKPPGGPRKTFCKRCGKILVTMDAHTRATHKRECYLREPHMINERERIEGGVLQIPDFEGANLHCDRT
jgi:hypothetical protein